MSEGRFKQLTLLHSNDLHGDFLAESVDADLIGGVSLLSGYVNHEKRHGKNTLYCIAGDMLRGSLIDAEYRGLSTISIMNLLRPDIASLGNHEADYGLSHLLFLERCAKFPIVNANIFIKNPVQRLFSPYKLLHIDGMRIMFIGIITEDILSGIKSDNLISSLVDISDAAAEVGRICNAHRTIDVDLTILLTHIGFEEDKKLAALLDPKWGVDIIIGGHSHTVLEQPESVNDILIAQAGMGTAQIGRFDITVDTDTNSVHDYTWRLVPIDSEHCPRDPAIEKIIEEYKTHTDSKYGRILCRLNAELTHPSRYEETALGNLFADAFRACFAVDIVFLGSGSVRKDAAGPILTLGDLIELYPFNGKVFQLRATGAQLKKMAAHILREEAFEGDHTEFFQYSDGVEIVWSRGKQALEMFHYLGQPVEDECIYAISVQEFHCNNCETSFGIPFPELLENGSAVCIATAELDVLIEYLSENTPQIDGVEGRLVILP